MSMQDLLLDDSPTVVTEPRGTRAVAATLLRAASRMLDALAERLALVEAPAATEPMIEFHGDAAAPEGALYVNGQFIGRLFGVQRL